MVDILLQFIRLSCIHVPYGYSSLPEFNYIWLIAYGSVIGILDLGMIYYACRTTFSDPTDLTVRWERYHVLIK